MDILGTGSIYLEFIYELSENSSCTLDDLQNITSGQTPDMDYIHNHAHLRYRGIAGSGANVIYALSELKCSVGFLGVVGKDEYGMEILQYLHNVDTTLIRKFDATGVQISVFQGRQNAIFKYPNSNQYLSFIEGDLETIKASKYLLLGPVDNTNALKTHSQMLNLIDNEIPVFFMPGKTSLSLDEKRVMDIVSKSRIVFVTDEEILTFAGDSYTGCKELLSMGSHVAVCKNETNVRIVSKHSDYTIPIKKTVLVDDTDYLDSFAAGFLSAYVEGYSLESCGVSGTRLSALTSTAYGRNAYPDFKFLKHMLPERE